MRGSWGEEKWEVSPFHLYQLSFIHVCSCSFNNNRGGSSLTQQENSLKQEKCCFDKQQMGTVEVFFSTTNLGQGAFVARKGETLAQTDP